ISMSLDGFAAGPKDEVDRIFQWYFSGDTEFTFPGTEMAFKVSPASAEHMRQGSRGIGAIVTGRRNFDLAQAWGGHPPLGVPHFVVTHRPLQEWMKEGSPFTFVTGGVPSAVEKAKAAAGGKDIAVSSPNVMRQCLQAGLLDDINIDLVPLLLGRGVRLFEEIGIEPVELELAAVVEGQGVTHLRYAIPKGSVKR
ncbi:MAG: dihydrofolate reductase family protein, partial [Anaerolineales bacterium]